MAGVRFPEGEIFLRFFIFFIFLFFNLLVNRRRAGLDRVPHVVFFPVNDVVGFGKGRFSIASQHVVDSWLLALGEDASESLNHLQVPLEGKGFPPLHQIETDKPFGSSQSGA